MAWDGGPNGSYVATVEVTNRANQALAVTFDVAVTYVDDDGVVHKDGLIIDRLTATIEAGETLTITRDLPENVEEEIGEPRSAGAVILEVERA